MSHTLRKVNLGNSALVQATIVDYATGGETFTLAELGLVGSLVSVTFLEIVGNHPLTPILQGGKVVLLQGATTELAPTVGVNFPLVAIVIGN
jgi:hypothetical protein